MRTRRTPRISSPNPNPNPNPSLHPYDYLLWFMRIVALLYLAAEILRFVAYARIYPAAAGEAPPSLGLDLPAAPPPAPRQ